MDRPSKWAAGFFLAAILALALVLLSQFVSGPSGRISGNLPRGTGAAAVAIGDNHGVILASDGSLWTWGDTGFGWQVLGLGTNVRTQPCLRRIGLDTNWVNVAVGGSTTLALKSDGTIWAWGQNLYGQLGDGTTVRERASPVRSVPGDDWKQVATSGVHSAALKQDGTLWSWGSNWAGQLGDGTTNHSREPARVGSSTSWTRIWANLIQNVGQQSDGSLWFWGWDYTHSEKGSSIPVPTRVSPDTNWVDVGMGDWMVLAIKSDGTLWAWGRQAHVYTGGSPNTDSTPVRVGTDSDWRACSSFRHSCPMFLKRDGSLWIMDASDHRGVASVTAIVSGLVTNNRLNFVVDSTILGGDPAFGIVKSLQIACQLGGTNQVLTFKEHSPVIVGRAGETLIIIRALYGDPRLFGDTAGPWLQPQPAQLRRVQLQKDIVAFCGGRHRLGVALTSEGEVWTWGEALGEKRRPSPILQFGSSVLGRLGVSVNWGEPRAVVHEQPTSVGKSD